MPRCPICGTKLPRKANYCWNCGAALAEARRLERRLDARAPLQPQLWERFQWIFRRQITEEQGPERIPEYWEFLHESGFREVVDRRIDQMDAAISDMNQDNRMSADALRALVALRFEELLDYFLIHHCASLNRGTLNEAILQHQQAPWKKIRLSTLIEDYLQLKEDIDRVYFPADFLQLSAEKMRNAGQSFLFASKGETIFFIVDQSTLGNLGAGFAMTDRALYWKAPLHKSRLLTFDNIQSLSLRDNWLLVNDQFFNTSATLNLRMLKLLRKIKLLQEI